MIYLILSWGARGAWGAMSLIKSWISERQKIFSLMYRDPLDLIFRIKNSSPRKLKVKSHIPLHVFWQHSTHCSFIHNGCLSRWLCWRGTMSVLALLAKFIFSLFPQVSTEMNGPSRDKLTGFSDSLAKSTRHS